MKKESRAMRRPALERRGERGQILIMFTLAVVVIVGMMGLVLDGGAAYAQRRAEQGVADLAAMAGATAYLSTQGGVAAKSAAADAAARVVATANGYTEGLDDATVEILVSGHAFGATVRANVTDDHRNNFASLVGMPTWDVSVTAAAETSERPNGAIGAMPLLFNAEAFPGAICDETAPVPCTPEVYQLPGGGNEDVPQDATQFNWTIFCTANGNPCNGDSNGVRDLIDQGGDSTTIYLNDDIGPLNAGAHTTLFNGLESHTGGVFPVPIVNDEGEMVGFAYFKLLSVEGASEKVIRGYFISPVNAAQLVVSPTGGDAELNTGVYVLHLVD
jgi:Flp pilus assembly protein TadG